MQTDGWGRAAADYYKAFTLTNHNIEGESIVLSQQVRQSPPPFIKLANPSYKPDVIFQQMLPDYMVKTPAKNIGFTFTETTKIYDGWVDKLNEMDEVWVATQQESENLLFSGVCSNIEVIPMPMSLLEGTKLTLLKESIGDRYTFYTVGEFVERKNIEALIKAYYVGFNKNDNVLLIIKTNFGNVSAYDLKCHAMNTLSEIQKRLRLYKYSHEYPEIMFLTEKFTDEQIAALHGTCDCFILSSRGESTCRPLIDAAFHNNTIICTDGIGANDEDLDIIRVKSREEICEVVQPPTPYLYSANERWMEIDVLELAGKMRFAPSKKPNNNKEIVNAKHSYQSVAARIERTL